MGLGAQRAKLLKSGRDATQDSYNCLTLFGDAPLHAYIPDGPGPDDTCGGLFAPNSSVGIHLSAFCCDAMDLPSCSSSSSLGIANYTQCPVSLGTVHMCVYRTSHVARLASCRT